MVFKADIKLIKVSLAAVLLCFVAPAAHAEQKPYVGDMQTYVTKYEDTLPEIARKFDVGFNELRSANPYVDPWMPGKDVKLTIPSRHILPDAVRQGIVINLPEMRLYVYNKGTLMQSHPIGVGREGLSTPVGRTTIVRKVVGPIWRPTERMRQEHPELPVEVGPGPENPMGTHAMYLGWPQYAIHGTDKPYAIGRRASSGCIRMYPEDIIQVYPAVDTGSSVTVVNQPVKVSWIGNTLYLEAHPPLDQAMMIEENGGRPYYDLTDDDMAQIMRVAGDRADMIDWAKVRSVIRNREGYPVAVNFDSSDTIAQDRDDDKDSAKTVVVEEPVTIVPPMDEEKVSKADPEEIPVPAVKKDIAEKQVVKKDAVKKDMAKADIADDAKPVKASGKPSKAEPAVKKQDGEKPARSFDYNVNG